MFLAYFAIGLSIFGFGVIAGFNGARLRDELNRKRQDEKQRDLDEIFNAKRQQI